MLPLILAAATLAVGAPEAVPALAAPRLLGPPANARVPYSVTFEWGAAAGAAKYHLQVADSAAFSDLFVDETLGAQSYQTDLLTSEPVWWRVRAIDAKGEPGRWSAARRLDIQPPPPAESVQELKLMPAAVAAGDDAEGVVTLEEPAPGGGATVELGMSDSPGVSMPRRVLFAEGEISAPFTIRTSKQALDAEVRILARSRGETRSAILTIGEVKPGVLNALAVHPAVLGAGNAARGMINLAHPSPGISKVLLSSSDPARVSVPASVTIRPGEDGGSFVVRSSHATSAGRVTLTASLAGAVRSASLDLIAAEGHDALSAPDLGAPADFAVVSRRGPNQFSWSPVIGAASYTIEIARSAEFGMSLTISRDVPFTSVVLTTLPVRGALWWRVRANDMKGSPGDWSEPRMLR